MDINEPSVDGNTLLHIAVIQGHEDIIKWLLDQDNLDRSTKTIAGKTAFEIAAEKAKNPIESGSSANINYKEIANLLRDETSK